MATKPRVNRTGANKFRPKRRPDPKASGKQPSKPLDLPKDYIFVPKGDVYVTRNCRKLTTLAGKVIILAGDPSAAQGLYCPNKIFNSVIQLARQTAATRQNAVAARDQRSREDARTTVLGLFPSMPSQDLEKILDHGFEKGSRRVGRSTKLDKSGRAILAVQAHVRHVHTDYDGLIRHKKGGSRGSIASKDVEAIRQRVLPQCNAILSQWRRRKSMQSPKAGSTKKLQGQTLHPPRVTNNPMRKGSKPSSTAKFSLIDPKSHVSTSPRTETVLFVKPKSIAAPMPRRRRTRSGQTF